MSFLLRLAPFLSALFFSGCVATLPTQSIPMPSPPASSYVVFEHHSKKILYKGGASIKRQVGSLANIATAAVVLDWAAAGGDLNEFAVVPPSAARLGEPNPLQLQPGDGIAIRDALYACLMASDNYSAEALAAAVGSRLLRSQGRNGDPISFFVGQMNGLAGRLGMNGTRFTNPHGVDHLGNPPHSNALDMARLSSYALGKSSFIYYCSQKTRRISYSRQGETRSFTISNTNQLVGRSGIDGLRTGQSRLAGPCIIVTSSKSPKLVPTPDGRQQIFARRVVVVLLGAPDRFGGGQRALAQGWGAFDAWSSAGRPQEGSSFLKFD